MDKIQKQFIIGTLLATICCVLAQNQTERIPAEKTTPTLTSAATSASPKEVSDVKPGRRKFSRSVVQDWNSLCNQLCGAGLGGSICGPQCPKGQDTLNTTQLEKAHALLKDKEKQICEDLCIFGLGDSVCKCPQKSPPPKGKSILNRNEICTTFCKHNDLTLVGCSICEMIEDTTTISPAKSKPLSTTPNWDEVCVVFCKTGDGGSLCNCDLPPFL